MGKPVLRKSFPRIIESKVVLNKVVISNTFENFPDAKGSDWGSIPLKWKV